MGNRDILGASMGLLGADLHAYSQGESESEPPTTTDFVWVYYRLLLILSYIVYDLNHPQYYRLLISLLVIILTIHFSPLSLWLTVGSRPWLS